MYNRYIPQDASFERVSHGSEPTGGTRPAPPGRPGLFQFPGSKDGLNALLSGKGLSALTKGFRLEELETGDILLALILLYLLVEGEDLEPVVAIGLVLLLGLGDR